MRRSKERSGNGGASREVVQSGQGIRTLDFLQQYRGDDVVALDLSSNKIQRTAGVEHLAALTLLDLSDNEIGRIDGLSRLPQLQTLRLGSNNISRIENLDGSGSDGGGGLRRLSTLDLSNNRIERVEGLLGLRSLTDLDLASNSISELGDLGALTALRALSLRGNLIKELRAVPLVLPRSLQQLNLADNMVANLAELQHLAHLAHGLQHILLSGNVFGHTAKACGFSYRPLVVALLPSIQSIDDQLVGPEERQQAVRLFSGRSGA